MSLSSLNCDSISPTLPSTSHTAKLVRVDVFVKNLFGEGDLVGDVDPFMLDKVSSIFSS
jgi:hypothetical protein